MADKRVITIALSKQIKDDYIRAKSLGYRDADIFRLGLYYISRKNEVEEKIKQTTQNLEGLTATLTATANVLSKVLNEFSGIVGKALIFSQKIDSAIENIQKMADVSSKLEAHDIIIANLLDTLKKIKGKIMDKESVKELLIDYYTKTVKLLQEKQVYQYVAEDLTKLHRSILDKLESNG